MDRSHELIEFELEQLRGQPVGAWELLPLVHNSANAVTSGIGRVSVDGWSAVLKVLSADNSGVAEQWRASVEPSHWNYWKREALVYEHGLPDRYAGSGIEAPRLLGRFERGEGEIALWLEDVGGSAGPSWSIERFERAAWSLGLAQGSVAANGGPPDHPWLSRRFLRTYSGSKPAPWELLDDDGAWAQPLVRDCFPATLRGQLLRMHAERERWLALIESLPRTLCHLDLWPPNMVARDPERTVLVDWAFAGDGAIGEDLGNLVPDCVFDLFLPASDLPELDRRLFRAYVDGLRQGGWHGDERLVRLAVCASAVKYDWLAPLMLAGAAHQQQLAYGGEQTVSAELRYAERGATLAFLAGWIEEARQLARALAL